VVQASPGIKQDSQKLTKAKGARVVARPPNKHKALGSTPITIKNKRKLSLYQKGLHLVSSLVTANSQNRRILTRIFVIIKCEFQGGKIDLFSSLFCCAWDKTQGLALIQQALCH
jgi:hypothetical protein